ncbi:MAG: hypothetical protein IJ459_05500 [Clostridia bacterium]|nr:hypothetical protein [Clostridia bacterium]
MQGVLEKTGGKCEVAPRWCRGDAEGVGGEAVPRGWVPRRWVPRVPRRCRGDAEGVGAVAMGAVAVGGEGVASA